jgi:hypothetical protein
MDGLEPAWWDGLFTNKMQLYVQRYVIVLVLAGDALSWCQRRFVPPLHQAGDGGGEVFPLVGVGEVEPL